MRRLMARGPEFESVNSDAMIHAWIRYGISNRDLRGRYAADLRYHFYVGRNRNLHQPQ